MAMTGVKIHEFKVHMSCEGCSSAVQKVLSKYKDKGVQNIDISLKDQMVSVTTTMTADEVLELIKKSGKPVEYLTSK